MYIRRDMSKILQQSGAMAEVLLGPRQCGKSTLFEAIGLKTAQSVSFDDLSLRQLANHDPALFLEQFKLPLLLDEVQYVPNLFPEIKKRIDEHKKLQRFSSENTQAYQVLFRLTGSNQILMDKNVKETLVGRAAYYYLNTLTVHEILAALPNTRMADILFQGGWPELYVNPDMTAVNYINDYIRSYVEKEIALQAGIHKLGEFHTFLGLLAARTGQLLDYSNISQQCGVSSVTVKDWVSLLLRSDLLYTLPPYASNLNKRLIKTPKLYFLDTGLAVRLQGWQEAAPLMNSPQIGSVFETLVLAEIIKFIRNYRKDWQLFFWRTKEGEEIDCIIKTSPNQIYAFEAKYAIQNIPKSTRLPATFQKHFSLDKPLTVVTFGGSRLALSQHCEVVPIAALHNYLEHLTEV